MLGIGELLRHEDRVVGGFGVVAKRGGEDHLGISCGCGRTSDCGLAGSVVNGDGCVVRLPRDAHASGAGRQREVLGSGCGHSGLDSGLGLVEHLSVIQLGHVCGADGSVVYGVIVHVELGVRVSVGGLANVGDEVAVIGQATGRNGVGDVSNLLAVEVEAHGAVGAADDGGVQSQIAGGLGAGGGGVRRSRADFGAPRAVIRVGRSGIGHYGFRVATRVGRVEQPVAVGRIIAGLGRADVRGGGIAVAVIVLEPDGDGNVPLTGDGRGRHANGLRAGQVDLAIGHRGVAG